MRCETVVGGTLSIHETAVEGPMGEYASYPWPGPGTPKPLYRVSAMTHRHDPILLVSVAGEPPEENHTAWGIPNAAEIVYGLRGKGFPIATAWSPFESANHWHVLAVEPGRRKDFPGVSAHEFGRRIGVALLGSKVGMGTPKYLVVNDDVDVTNLAEVVWAFATRNHPGTQGEVVFNEEATNPLVAFLTGAEKMSAHTTKVVHNCLPPDKWGDRLPVRSSFHHSYPLELQARVLHDWTSYGFASSSFFTMTTLPIADPATIARNLAAARRFIEGVLGGAEPTAFAEVVAENVVVDTGFKPVGKIEGRAKYGRVLGDTTGAAFTNGHLEIKDLTALMDGRVLARFEASADNTGALNGVAATGRRFTFCELHLMRFDETGKLVENWVGALNPLMFEFWQVPVTAPLVLAQAC